MQDLVWDLSGLFKNKEEFYKSIEEVRECINKFESYKKVDLDKDNLFLILNQLCDIKELVNNIWVYGNLVYYKNVNDEECINMKKQADSFYNEICSRLKFVDSMILDLGESKVKDFINDNKDLEVYSLYLDNLFRLKSHVQNEDVNKKIKSNNDIMDDEKNKYNELSKSIVFDDIDVNGELVPMNSTNFVKFISSRDRETRKQAYLSVYNSYMKESDKFASILNSLFNIRIENANLEKYDSVLESVLSQENISPNVIDNLLISVNKNLSLMQRYLDLKIKVLGVENPHLYDFNVPMDSDLKLKYSLEEGVEIVRNSLKPLGSEYLKVVDLLLDGHVDAIPDENKHQSMTFSWNVYSFLNYRNSYVDIKNLTHELGHIVNYYLSKGKVPFIYEDSTVFVGETASIVNEILLTRYLFQNAKSDEERIFYLSKEIENYFTSVFKQVMYTEFENKLYDIAKSSDLSSEVLISEYEKLIRKYYGDNIVYDDVAFYEWSRLGHLYRWSYYPYKYATGLLIASNVVDSLVLEGSLSKEKYMEFLSSGSSMYSLDLLKMLDIDLSNSDVLDKGFKVLENDINYLEKILNLEK